MVLLAGILAGCGTGEKDPYVRQPVAGMITFNGSPLTSGAITFFPENNGSVASGAPIVNGKYSISKKDGLPAGTYKVSISSPVPKASANANAGEFPVYEERIPGLYNTKTTLICELPPDNQKEISFDLVSNPK